MKFRISSIALLVLSSMTIMGQEVLVLGIGQDAGKPQLACTKECCKNWDSHQNGSPVSLAVLDSSSQQWFLFEASPAITEQWAQIPPNYPALPAAIFISHAHMGHYGGLLQLGREASNSSGIPVYAGNRFCEFIKQNGPWNQLVDLDNIRPVKMPSGSINLKGTSIWIEALEVPHRDEYSETLAFLIKTNGFQLLFIPDIDKWERWETNIDSLIQEVDIALLDATFYDENELPNRNMNEIPHPFVVESMARWMDLPPKDKKKVHFIHLNHSNPLWYPESPECIKVKEAGFQIARPGMRFPLNL